MGISLIDNVFEETLKYLEGMPKTKRKEIGQFFTSVETARYMASMFECPCKSELTVLDAGAGSGILTAAIIERLQNDECTVELGFVFTDILTNYERISDHCSNIAVYTLQMNSSKLDAHKYLNKLKVSSNEAYIEEYKNYSAKYSIDDIEVLA